MSSEDWWEPFGTAEHYRFVVHRFEDGTWEVRYPDGDVMLHENERAAIAAAAAWVRKEHDRAHERFHMEP